MLESKFYSQVRDTVFQTLKLKHLREHPDVSPDPQQLRDDADHEAAIITSTVLGNRNVAFPTDYRQMWEATIRYCAITLDITKEVHLKEYFSDNAS